MNDNHRRDLLIAFSLLPFLTPNRTRLLLESFEPIETALDAPLGLLRDLLRLTPQQSRDVKNPLTKEVSLLREHCVTLADSTYPPLLRMIPDPPLALHVRGDVSLLARPSIAIVGSRRASPYAINATQYLARTLAPTGLVIVSGLARGVDAASHQATLDAGGATIAVLGTGIDIVYPRSNARLFRRIESEGLIVSEFPPGAPPRPEHFPIRNRVISGICHGTVVVEATRKSGSLITARMALEQGREVFAVPGSIFSAGSEGTHRLIQLGAKLVHDAGDIVEELQCDLRPIESPTATEPEPEPPLRDVLAALSLDEPTHIDHLATHLGRTSADVAEALLQLEMDGWIRALPGARFVRQR